MFGVLCNFNHVNASNLFTVKTQPDGVTNMCWQPKGGGHNPDDNTDIVLASDCENLSALFTLTDNDAIQHVLSGKCIHPHGAIEATGTKLVLHSGCGTSASEVIDFIFRGTTAPACDLTNEDYCQIEQQSGLSVTYEGDRVILGDPIAPTSFVWQINSTKPHEISYPVPFAIQNQFDGYKCWEREFGDGSGTPNNNDKISLGDNCEKDWTWFIDRNEGVLTQYNSGSCIHPLGGINNVGNDTALVFYDQCPAHEGLRYDFLVQGPVQYRYDNQYCVHPQGGADNVQNNPPLVLHQGCVPTGEVDDINFAKRFYLPYVAEPRVTSWDQFKVQMSSIQPRSKYIKLARNGNNNTQPAGGCNFEGWDCHAQGVVWPNEGKYVYVSTSDAYGSINIYEYSSEESDYTKFDLKKIVKYDTSGKFRHASGMAYIGGLLVVGYETMSNYSPSPDSKVVFFSLDDPTNPVEIYSIDNLGESGASSVGIAKWKDEVYVLSIYDYKNRLLTLLTNSSKNRTEFTVGGKKYMAPHFDRTMTIIPASHDYQNMGLFVDTNDVLWLLGLWSNTNTWIDVDGVWVLAGGTGYVVDKITDGVSKIPVSNEVDYYKIDLSLQDFHGEDELRMDHITRTDSTDGFEGDHTNFIYGGSHIVTPDGKIKLIMTEADNYLDGDIRMDVFEN